jgi:heat shock protein HtpX
MMSKFYNNMKTAVLMGAMTGLILLIGHLLGGMNGVVIALIFAAVMNFVGYFFSDKIALMTMRAQEVGPKHELYQIVEQLTRRANLPMPRVYVSPQPAPNAFATGRSPHHAAVCATEGLLQMLDRDEVAAVMSHELAHVKHRDILIQSVAATIGGAITYLVYLFAWGGGGRSRDGEGANPVITLLVFLLGPLAAMLIQAAISRSREFNADKEGAELLGDPMPLASALEKIHAASQRMPMDVNPAFNSMFIAEPLNAMRTMANLFQTHPPLEARLMNLIGRESTGRYYSTRSAA